MIFAEACADLSQYCSFVDALGRPHSVLANVTEFSLTPAFSLQELGEAGVAAALYPLSAARAMAAAAQSVYRAILDDGSVRNVLNGMQQRAELYEVLRYHEYEAKYDALFANTQKK